MLDNMEKEKIVEVSNDVENKSNKDLFLVVNELYEEYDKTKELIIDLTNHLENVEIVYNKVNDEIAKRLNK
jgi:hypothetical protein